MVGVSMSQKGIQDRLGYTTSTWDPRGVWVLSYRATPAWVPGGAEGHGLRFRVSGLMLCKTVF